MSVEDVFDFKFNYNERGGVAYMGKIKDPPAGYGNGSVSPVATDPRNGHALTYTNG
jgi:hypothetical protein